MLLLYTISIIFFIGFTEGSDGTFRIMGGHHVEIQDYPYVVSIHKISFLKLDYQCGGSLISPRFVLTAAHCFQPRRFHVIKAGLANLEGPLGDGHVSLIISVKKHPKYSPYTKDYDIAVAKLLVPLQLSEKINIVKLPSFSEDLSLGEGTVLGWGYTEFHENSPCLKAVDVPILDVEECVGLKSRGLPDAERMFCSKADSGFQRACEGDSGGPLVINGTIYGVVSWGQSCQSNPYGHTFYMRVSYFVDFINETLGDVKLGHSLLE